MYEAIARSKASIRRDGRVVAKRGTNAWYAMSKAEVQNWVKLHSSSPEWAMRQIRNGLAVPVGDIFIRKE